MGTEGIRGVRPSEPARGGEAVKPSVERAVDELCKAMKGIGTDETKIFSILEGAGPDDLRAIEERFAERHGTARLPTLRAALEDELGGPELARALRALDGLKDGAAPQPSASPPPAPGASEAAQAGHGQDLWARMLEASLSSHETAKDIIRQIR